MPISHLNRMVSEYFERHNIYGGSVKRASARSWELRQFVSKSFFVSQDAARVRLGKLGYLADHDTDPTLFGS